MKYPDLESRKKNAGASSIKGQIIDQLVREKTFSGNERILSLYLFDQDIDRDGILWRGYESIQKDLGLSRSTVKRCFKSLEGKNFLKRAYLYTDTRRSEGKAIVLNTALLMRSVGEEEWKGCPFKQLSEGTPLSK